MKTVIVYATTHGSTKKCAELLQEKIQGEAHLVNLEENPYPNISGYDAVIIGGSIHCGQINYRVKKFSFANQESLQNKKIGIYICFMDDENKARKCVANSIPEPILKSAFSVGYFGGELKLEAMSDFEKMLIQRIKPVNHSISKINLEKIDDFAAAFNQVLAKHNFS
jgi:menaquinone-dependent protoporphyrinogen oxidase